MRAMSGSSRSLGEGGRFSRNSAPDPFANGVAGTPELTSGGFDSILPSVSDHFLVKPMAICAHAIEFKITAVHPGKMALSARAVRPSAAAAQGAPRFARPAAGELRARRVPAAGPEAADPQTSLSAVSNSFLRPPLNTFIFGRGSRSTQLFPETSKFAIDRQGGASLWFRAVSKNINNLLLLLGALLLRSVAVGC